MRLRSFVLVGVSSLFLVMPVAAEPVDDEQAVPAVLPAATAMPEAIEGMTCVSESGTEAPAVLGGDSIVPAAAGGIPDCPVSFSDCPDVPGRNCGLRSCVAVDLGFNKCKRAGGGVLKCTNGNLQQTTCDCEDVFHMVCCDLENCSFGVCGVCSGGSQTTVCP